MASIVESRYRDFTIPPANVKSLSFDEGQRMIKVLSTPPSGEQSLLSSHAACWSSKKSELAKTKRNQSHLCSPELHPWIDDTFKTKKGDFEEESHKGSEKRAALMEELGLNDPCLCLKAFHVELKCQCGHDSIILLVPFVSNQALIALWRSITCFRRVGACCATI